MCMYTYIQLVYRCRTPRRISELVCHPASSPSPDTERFFVSASPRPKLEYPRTAPSRGSITLPPAISPKDPHTQKKI